MACSGTYAEPRDYQELICTKTYNLADEPRLAAQLTITAGPIHAARAASNQCACTLEPWAEDYLKHLNIVLAAATQDCPCSTLSAEDKAAYLAFANAELEKIRTRQIDLCGGTGKDYPAMGAIQYGHTVFARAEIIQNRLDRESS